MGSINKLIVAGAHIVELFNGELTIKNYGDIVDSDRNS
jgi:hypothetical protein